MWSEVFGQILVPDDSFLQSIRVLCDEKNWFTNYSQPNLSVFSKSVESSDFNIFKVKMCLIMLDVFVPALPPRKQFIRAVSFLTAYRIQPLGANSCSLTYLNHCDPRGEYMSL
ncbi:hypothetical protein FBUS_01964 [Fasciolopsis buskii]|uniref:START domain-containing protein n=1 Tax=Fasciolopsis buskii TaxID=27845 RepID=A0A8E0RRS0_9TREM|nr:hypothetical protein FBUS_01964 [Fasciolopsis buski]